MSLVASKTARLEARVSNQQKELFQRAADLTGRTLTEFVVVSVEEAAMRTLERSQSMKLTKADQKVFVDALVNPTSPGQTLRDAAKRYKKVIGE